MNVAEENRATRLLYASAESEWFLALDSLVDSIHPVDREATRIWYFFWPLKLTESLKASQDPVKTAQELLLYGKFELKRALQESVTFLYGARWWHEVAQSVLDFARAWEAGEKEASSLKEAIRQVAVELSKRTTVSEELLLGITAVAFFALRHLGPEDFRNALNQTDARNHFQRSPEEVISLRKGRTKKKFWDFLYTVNRRHTVTWDEEKDCTFPAINNQYLAMAAAADQEDYRNSDPRRVEGPIPVQCRNGACGFCWIGVLGGKENLSEMADFERKRLETLGYVNSGQLAESHPHLRLACQARVTGDVTIVIPPWNGFLDGR